MPARRIQQQGASRLGWLFSILGVFVLLLVALVWFFPASKAVDWAGERLKPLQLDGVSGSVWNGQGQASLNGQALGRLRWQASPLSMLGMNQRMQLQ
ncbi:MAG: type II secretion system protein N, partial [Lysobacteraceae bacterium]